MRTFLLATLGYFVIAVVLSLLLYPDPSLVTDRLQAVSSERIGFLKSTVIWFLPVALIGPFLCGRGGAVGESLLAAAGCIQLQAGFSLTKTLIPLVLPFYADPTLARLDRALHGGVDPWVALHGATDPDFVLALVPVYLQVWIVPAMALPVFIVATDDNRARRDRYTILFLFCWVFLGNVLAVLAASVGPVFYDSLIGGSRFAALTEALARSGIRSSIVGQIQDYLWTSYQAQTMAPASGISAFPSVHVAIATLTALYLGERRIYWLPVGILFVATTLFLSVYTGYHYAIDGYFSIAAVVGLWAWLRHLERAVGAQENYAAD